MSEFLTDEELDELTATIRDRLGGTPDAYGMPRSPIEAYAALNSLHAEVRRRRQLEAGTQRLLADVRGALPAGIEADEETR